MNSSLRPQQRRRNSDDNMIPLINIVFLLLIFFMIAGQISNSSHAIAAPFSASKKPIAQQPVVLIMSADNSLSLNQTPVSLDELNASLFSEAKVWLKADKNIKARELDLVLNKLRSLNIGSITLYSQTHKRAPTPGAAP
jgi:biopolymer transport protein ExbD